MTTIMWRASCDPQGMIRLFRCGRALQNCVPARSFHSNGRKLHAASANLAVRFRPVYVLLGTGGGYAAYKQYENYKDLRLEKLGVDVPPKVAHTWEGLEDLALAVADPRMEAMDHCVTQLLHAGFL